MTEQVTSGRAGLRLHPPAPKGFDPFTATTADLKRHGLPLRPDPRSQPGLAALWDRLAARYRSFDHLEPRPDTTTAGKKAVTASALGPDPIASCGYSLASLSAPFIALFITWTVPDLQYSPGGFGPNHFHTFAGLGFLDVHVEMTVDSAHNVTSQLWAQGVGNPNLPVGPGDVISASMCLATNASGRAHYFFANQTRSQTMNFTFDTGFPPAVTIDAGVTRDGFDQSANPPLARFGAVYFDEITAYTTSGPRSLTTGDAITMVDGSGSTLARPVQLNDSAFKAVIAPA